MAVKKRTDPDWQDLRVFLALGRSGSLSAAARILSVNHATVARRVQALEASLGERLVERRPDGYILTAAGAHALAAAHDMEASVQALERGGPEDLPKGLVRVNASPALAQGYLFERLARVPLIHPGLDIELATDLRAISLERHEADIAIRLSRPQDGDLMARRLTLMGHAFYGAPEVCRRVEAGEEARFVGFDEANADVPEAAFLSREFPHARLTFRANNQVAQAIAARLGAGLALLPHYIGRTDRDLSLCRLGPIPPPREVWLLTRRRGRNDLPIRTVTDYIVGLFDRERALFEP